MADANSSQKLVTRWDVPKEDLPSQVLTAAAGGRLFLLPDKTIDGVGIYRDDVAGLVKTLRHNGVDIDFASAREDRRYLSEYGAAGEVVGVIALAVVGNYTGDLIKSIARTAWQRARSAIGTGSSREEVESATVTVRIAEIVRSDQETVIRGLEVTSPVVDIESLLRGAISDRRPTDLPPGSSDTTGSEGVPE
ncbi:hypothetical protein [Streptomyces exfoliatus]|uniref:hypothetical protein n=1 Tax=Streptomyces exfoliatus TaxID=1905 RepID=UPI0004B6641A|nr:hypothetical protein [Streptomyces exfoliatus]